MVTWCQGYRLRHLTALDGGQAGAMLCLDLTPAFSTSQLYSLEQRTFSFETRKTNVIIFSFPEMSNSTESQTFSQMTSSSESTLDVWAWFAQGGK